MTKVKICGITNLEDASLCVEYGADMLGFNFYSRSPRYVSPDVVREIVDELPEGILKIGVFVNEPLDTICDTVAASGINAIQLHGDELPDFVVDLKKRTNGHIIKAFRVSPKFEARTILNYDLDGVLLDAFVDDLFGGTGNMLDLETATKIKRYVPNYYLAGGLTPENVGGIVSAIAPFAVDVASGVESAPGKKDAMKIEAFIRNAKNA